MNNNKDSNLSFTNKYDVHIHVDKNNNRRTIKRSTSTIVFAFSLCGLLLVLALVLLLILIQVKIISQENDYISIKHDYLFNRTKSLKNKIIKIETKILNLRLKAIKLNLDNQLIHNVSSYIIATANTLTNIYNAVASQLDLTKTSVKDIKKITFKHSLEETNLEVKVSNLIIECKELTRRLDKMKDINIVKHNQGKYDSNPYFSEPMFINSVIITSQKHYFFLRSYLAQDNKDTFGFSLIYRASRDGYTIESFRNKCGQLTKTVIVIKNFSGCIYGGYTNQIWNGNGFKQDLAAFLFNLSYSLKYKNATPSEAIYINENILFQFGQGDLTVTPNRRVISLFPVSYNKEALKYSLMCGERDAHIEEIEVFVLFEDDIM